MKAAALDGAGYWALRRLFSDTGSFGRVLSQYEAFAGTSLGPLISEMEAAVRATPSVLARESREPINRRTAVRAGAAACERVLQRYTRDGYAPRGGIGGGNPTSYRARNAPQVRAGITNCDAQMRNLNLWQPLCIPNGPGGFGTTDCTVQGFLYPWAGRFTPFALQPGNENTGQRLTNPPPQAGSAQFRREWEEVLE